MAQGHTKPGSGWLRPVLVVVGIGGLLALGYALDAQARLAVVMAWVEQLGWLGVGLFVAFYILACVLLLPGAILTLGAGFVYGVVKGSIIVSVASTVGATAAFLVGRYLARDWVRHKIEGNAGFKAIDEAVGREGWRIVALTRLSPVIPFNLLNYAYGVTRVPLGQYTLASWIAMLPGTVMYVYLGSLAGSLTTLAADAGDKETSPTEWALYGVGLLATVAVTIYVTNMARRALQRRIEPQGDAS